MTVSTSKTYHHGDLRAAAIEAGLGLLEERKADDLGLREVARAVGVSATALYRHFPDKAALLRTLAHAGLDRLAAAQREAAAAAGGGESGFGATGRAYVHFALANPALFRLIFSASPEPGDPFSRPAEEMPEAFRMLWDNAARLAPPDAGPQAAPLIALEAWALVHGLAILILDGQIPRNDALIDAILTKDAL
ncbi:TetR/AcrR family transcriptional regulator [Allosphingosinicella sp.]|uniref:TetR/AcrR family transcriptional regulator n=1 Tax=Allosphingosinicella sp. TaxID=2823234 RepID=UPI003782D771